MPELPPAFFSDPARILHVEATDEAFTGPSRLARETAAATVASDGAAMADALSRAWRSGAPDELLDGLLMNYATAHELGDEDVQAIACASRFVTALPLTQRVDDITLLGNVAAHVAVPLGEALAAAQEDDDPCWCPSCIAEAASLN